jgi:hypothetical protein
VDDVHNFNLILCRHFANSQLAGENGRVRFFSLDSEIISLRNEYIADIYD